MLLAFISALGGSPATALVLDQPTFLEVCAPGASQAKEGDVGTSKESEAGAGGGDQGGGEESSGRYASVQLKLNCEYVMLSCVHPALDTLSNQAFPLNQRHHHCVNGVILVNIIGTCSAIWPF